MKIAVLFDGGGLARLGLEKAGHECIGFEIDPVKHYLSKMVGSGNCVLADATKVNLDDFDAVWASPPCQLRSNLTISGLPKSKYAQEDYVEWCLQLPHKVLWVENVFDIYAKNNEWGKHYNAAQFLEEPIQKRKRIVGGRFNEPFVFREFQHDYPKMNICPSILASEYKGNAKDKARASRWYGRRLSLREVAYHQGFEIPDNLLNSWFHIPCFKNKKGKRYTFVQWRNILYETIGNGVPVYMAEAFGKVHI